MIGHFLALALATTPYAGVPKLGEPVGDMANWFDDSDWTASRAGGSVRFKIVFNQDGSPDTCIIEATSGNKEVEALACAMIRRRFRFKPSINADGAPVSRVFVRAVTMAGQTPDAIRPPALFSLTVKGYDNLSRVSVVADVNKDGSLADCASSDKKAALIPLNKAICDSLKSLWEPLPEIDGTGGPIRYLRDIPVDIKHAP